MASNRPGSGLQPLFSQQLWHAVGLRPKTLNISRSVFFPEAFASASLPCSSRDASDRQQQGGASSRDDADPRIVEDFQHNKRRRSSSGKGIPCVEKDAYFQDYEAVFTPDYEALRNYPTRRRSDITRKPTPHLHRLARALGLGLLPTTSQQAANQPTPSPSAATPPPSTSSQSGSLGAVAATACRAGQLHFGGGMTATSLPSEAEPSRRDVSGGAAAAPPLPSSLSGSMSAELPLLVPAVALHKPPRPPLLTATTDAEKGSSGASDEEDGAAAARPDKGEAADGCTPSGMVASHSATSSQGIFGSCFDGLPSPLIGGLDEGCGSGDETSKQAMMIAEGQRRRQGSADGGGGGDWVLCSPVSEDGSGADVQ